MLESFPLRLRRIEGVGYETLKQVQGDRKKTFARGSSVYPSVAENQSFHACKSLQKADLQPIYCCMQESTYSEFLYQPDCHSRLSGIFLKSFIHGGKIPDKRG